MTSQNNPLTSHRGSALIVTMLLVSVLLVTALILLQRIIPYAKSVRSMHDASQSYYLARGQVDLARLLFLYDIGPGGVASNLRVPSVFGFLAQTGASIGALNTPKGERTNIASGRTTSGGPANVIDETLKETDISGVKIITVALPFMNLFTNVRTNNNTAYAVSSRTSQGPLKIKLFPTDNDLSVKKFGTSKEDPAYHRLYSRNAGGLRFDLRGVSTLSILTLVFSESITETITIKMQYYFKGPPEGNVITFTADYPVTSAGSLDLKNSGVLGNIQEITSSGSIISGTSDTLGAFLSNNCTNATICSLSLILNGTNRSVDFQIISDTSATIPDLNAVAIGDGISNNGLYYQRVIDLIPTPQDI